MFKHSIFALYLLAASAWANDCLTHERCTTQAVCSCIIPADSAYNRYYYLDFAGIKKGHIYQCQFSDSLNLLSAVFDQSTFPLGSHWESQESNRFPVSGTLNTFDMVNATDNMIIKYFVPGSDMPTNLSAHCYIVESSLQIDEVLDSQN